jgi:DNA-directed RNA polymerase specialized sigma24 family protein
MHTDLNLLHGQYVADPTEANLNRLLAGVTAYARILCRNRSVMAEDAAEVAQDTSLTCWTKLNQYDATRSSFRTWVHRLTLDQVSIHRRKAEAYSKDVEAHSPANVNPPQPATYSRRIHDVRKAAGDNANLIDLMLVHGDVATAARHLCITPLAVQRRLRRIGAKINFGEWSKVIAKMP